MEVEREREMFGENALVLVRRADYAGKSTYTDLGVQMHAQICL